MIDKLIEEALFEFISLQESEAVDQPRTSSGSVDTGAVPLSLDKFQQGRDWAREISVQQNPRSRIVPSPPQRLQAGNLAALEGDEDDEEHPLGLDETTGSERTERPEPIIPAMDAESSMPPRRIVRKGSSSAVAFVVVLVLLVVTAGAYYTGLLPGVGPSH
jgi:hypothetical protein